MEPRLWPDRSDLPTLQTQFGALTYIDEVHAGGITDHAGPGVAERDPPEHGLDISWHASPRPMRDGWL